MLKGVSTPVTTALPSGPRAQGAADGNGKAVAGGGHGRSGESRNPAAAGAAAVGSVDVQLASRPRAEGPGSLDLSSIDVERLSEADVEALMQSTTEQLSAGKHSLTNGRGHEELTALFQ